MTDKLILDKEACLEKIKTLAEENNEISQHYAQATNAVTGVLLSAKMAAYQETIKFATDQYVRHKKNELLEDMFEKENKNKKP